MTEHQFVQFGADAEGVVHDDVPQMVQAAVEPGHPGGGALQAVGGADVEHQEAVDGADQRGAVQIGGDQVGVPGVVPPLPPT